MLYHLISHKFDSLLKASLDLKQQLKSWHIPGVNVFLNDNKSSSGEGFICLIKLDDSYRFWTGRHMNERGVNRIRK